MRAPDPEAALPRARRRRGEHRLSSRSRLLLEHFTAAQRSLSRAETAAMTTIRSSARRSPAAADGARRRLLGGWSAASPVDGDRQDEDRRPEPRRAHATPPSRRARPSPRTTSTSATRPGVVFITRRGHAADATRRSTSSAAAAARHRDRLRLRDRQGRPHPHQRPRRRRRQQRSRSASATSKTVDAKVARQGRRATDVALLKVDPDGLRPHAARRSATSNERRGRRPGGRDRQPVRPRPHAHDRHRVARCSASSRRRTASRSTT